jgi:protein phosphatase
LTESALAFTTPATTLDLIAQLRDAIEKANRHVHNLGNKDPNYYGMGTTLCCLLWTESFTLYAHIGDSRIYRLRDQELRLLTEDHSLWAQWLATGKLAEESVTPYPYKNVITRALGTKHTAYPEISIATHQHQDLYLLCSDGLSDVLSLPEMETILCSNSSLQKAAETLITTAKIKGSSDNMTALIVRSVDSSGKDLS